MLEKTIEVRDQLGAEVKRMKEAVADAVDNGAVAARRAVKQGRRVAEDLVDDAEYRVKQHPFSALGVTFGIGVGLGAPVSNQSQLSNLARILPENVTPPILIGEGFGVIAGALATVAGALNSAVCGDFDWAIAPISPATNKPIRSKAGSGLKLREIMSLP
jgi:ElaB/YqjD/DUF883 family membrane-anchored ribosome-binding protein